MARIRTIKPNFWKHEDLSALPEATHMLAAALLNYADDEGYFNANPHLIKAECCPLREPSVSVHDSLTYLASIGYIRVGKGADGKTYGHVVNFDDHQRINRKTPSKIKNIEIVWEVSQQPHTQLTEPSHLEGNKEGNKEGNAAASAAASSPTNGQAENPETGLYRRGREVLGKSAGGLIKKLIEAKGGSLAQARAAVETASEKADPREYIGAIIRGKDPPNGQLWDPAL